MLRELSIQNFALFKELRVEFREGLNILTGATGAGKSILAGAIDLLLGGRAGAHMIRQGAPNATVEGVFDLSCRKNMLARIEQMGLLADQGLLVLKRQISKRGENRAYGNGSRLTMVQLKQVGDLLVDLHGQHDHQSLLRPREHRELLDDYGGLHSLREQVRAGYENLMSRRQELQELADDIQETRERQELFQFQLSEIQGVDPQKGEDEQLEVQKKILENAEQIFQGVTSAYQSLFEQDNAVIERLSVIRQTLEGLAKTDPVFREREQECAALLYQLEDLSSSLRQYAQALDRDPGRLEQVEDRLQELQRLKRKHGGTLSAVLRRKEELASELESLAAGDERLEELGELVGEAEGQFSQSCKRLSEARSQVAMRLQKEIEKELEHLGMPKTRFSVLIEQVENQEGGVEVSGRKYLADGTGIDRVEFLLSPNPGEGMRPLAKIASGGEISRIMLAMKSILAQADQVPLLIFDEIDVGIGGQVAQAVGQALKSLAGTHQVICITHLHQIACLADQHYLVHKQERDGRTETSIRSLTAGQREREIARMMGGKEITKITLEHAREMIRNREKPQASLS